jgi:hypothetical protein
MNLASESAVVCYSTTTNIFRCSAPGRSSLAPFGSGRGYNIPRAVIDSRDVRFSSCQGSGRQLAAGKVPADEAMTYRYQAHAATAGLSGDEDFRLWRKRYPV